jgi:hypothetical protein
MTRVILNFIRKHNVRPWVFTLIYVWIFFAAEYHSFPALVLSIFHVIFLLLIAEND